MCGIVGGTKKTWDYHAAVKSLRHRGPDDKRVVEHQDITLGFARLSIIDLRPEANQPMISYEGTVRIVFNGEIYGYKILREELIKKGHRFNTFSDTEVILNAYLEWGDDFTEHLDGMFAIALHDLRKRQLKIFRDRIGIKPLYYFYDGKEFAFASELKAIVKLCSDSQLDIDFTALYDYLTYLYIPDPKSLYKNVFKLPAAHRLTLDLEKNEILSVKPYWKLQVPAQPKLITIEDASEQLRALIHRSVRDQMIADVPVGFFLSGGMDSSTVVAEACLLSNQIETFSIGFDVQHHNETPYARQVAQQFKTCHHEKILSHVQTHGLLNHLATWFDEPFASTSAFPTFFVSQYARESVKVVLTGDGGDEIFGGYLWYHTLKRIYERVYFNKPLLQRSLFKLKSCFPHDSSFFKIFHQLELYTEEDVAFHARIKGGMSDLEKEKYALAWNIPKDYDSYWHLRKFYRKDLPILTRMQYLDVNTYLPCDILTKVDRTTMAVSLEARVPLLSRGLIEFSFSLPEEIRYFKGKLKGLLKEAYQNILPPDILNRHKQGFSIPKLYLDQEKTRKQERILKEIFKINSSRGVNGH